MTKDRWIDTRVKRLDTRNQRSRHFVPGVRGRKVPPTFLAEILITYVSRSWSRVSCVDTSGPESRRYRTGTPDINRGRLGPDWDPVRPRVRTGSRSDTRDLSTRGGGWDLISRY